MRERGHEVGHKLGYRSLACIVLGAERPDARTLAGASAPIERLIIIPTLF